MTARRIYCDLDGVVADFEAGAKAAGVEPSDFKNLPGCYLDLPIFAGAEYGVARCVDLVGGQNFYFLSKPPTSNSYAWAEKHLWVKRHFPALAPQLIIASDKSACGDAGDFLIDDRAHKGRVSDFRGTFLHFGHHPYETWDDVVSALHRALKV